MEAIIIVHDVYNITGIGVVPVGQVKKGPFRVGMRASINGKAATVKTIEMHHQKVQEAHDGDHIGFTLNGVGKKDIAKGVELTFTDDDAPTQSPPITNEPLHPQGLFTRLFRR